MAFKVTYAGVYTGELPGGVHAIMGVPTSITAFVGRAERGPVNMPFIISSYSDYDRIFGGLWQQSSMSFAVKDFFVNGGLQAIIVRLARPSAAPAVFVLPEDTAAAGIGSPLSHADLPPDVFSSLNLVAASPGRWGDDLSVLIDHATMDLGDLSLFNLTLVFKDSTHTTTLTTEEYRNVSVDPAHSQYIATTLVQNSNLALVRVDSSGTPEIPGSRPAATIIYSGSPSALMQAPVFGQNGDDGSELTSDDFIGPGTAANKQGLYALDNTDLFNILCIPPYSGDDVDVAVVTAAATYCKGRRAFYIVDPPSSWTNPQTALTQFTMQIFGITTETSSYAAMYFPRVLEPNPLLNNQLDTFVPCGVMAGVYSRTDSQRGVWSAPAGQETGLNGVSQLAVPLTDVENDQLNPLGLNCLRTFPIMGAVCWGARTLQGADALESQWRYVPVRRTALFIEESLYRGTKWVVFEPNDDVLWSSIRMNVGSFMQDLFRQGAFSGGTSDQAYFVKCDGETTTQNDIDSGIVNIVVGFAPLKPAEFVIIQIQQIAAPPRA
jgi:phage tail sheath protein FI